MLKILSFSSCFLVLTDILRSGEDINSLESKELPLEYGLLSNVFGEELMRGLFRARSSYQVLRMLQDVVSDNDLNLIALQSKCACIWNSTLGRQDRSRLIGDLESRYVIDIFKMIDLNISDRSIARWISAFYQVSLRSTSTRVLQVKKLQSKAKYSSKCPSKNCESQCWIEKRKFITLSLIGVGIERLDVKSIHSDELAFMVLAVSILCTLLNFDSHRYSFSWWFSYVEKIVSGVVPYMR